MSKNKIDRGIVGIIKGNEKKQAIQESNWFRGRHRVVMLTNKEILLNFAAVSDVASWTDKDVRVKSDTTASSVSADAIAVILQIITQDTGSAANTTYIQVRKNGSTDDPGTLRAQGGHVNSMPMYASGIVGIDSSYLIEYTVNASGAGTLTGTVNLIGYIEQLS